MAEVAGKAAEGVDGAMTTGAMAATGGMTKVAAKAITAKVARATATVAKETEMVARVEARVVRVVTQDPHLHLVGQEKHCSQVKPSS